MLHRIMEPQFVGSRKHAKPQFAGASRVFVIVMRSWRMGDMGLEFAHRTHSRLAGRRWLKSPAEAAACPSSMQQSRFRIASYNVLAKCYAKARHFTRCKPGGSLCEAHLASPCPSRYCTRLEISDDYCSRY